MGKIGHNNRLGSPPLRLAPSPRENPGSATDTGCISSPSPSYYKKSTLLKIRTVHEFSVYFGRYIEVVLLRLWSADDLFAKSKLTYLFVTLPFTNKDPAIDDVRDASFKKVIFTSYSLVEAISKVKDYHRQVCKSI